MFRPPGGPELIPILTRHFCNYSVNKSEVLDETDLL